MIYAYCRVSTPKQKLERQIENIHKVYPDAVIISDKYTGTNADRPGWQQLMKRVQPNDTIVFDSVSRMSRDAEEGFAMYAALYDKNVELIFLNEPHINTVTYRSAMDKQITAIATGDTMTDELMEGITAAINRYMMRLAEKQIKLAFEQSEKEVTDLHKRTADGIREAKRKAIEEGRTLEQGGNWHIGAMPGKKLTTKKSIEAKQIIRKHSKDFGGSLDDNECMKLAGISRNSYYKYKRELKAEQA